MGDEYIPAYEAMQAIPWQPQTQADLEAQLYALSLAAVRLGLYDANDYLIRQMRGVSPHGRRN